VKDKEQMLLFCTACIHKNIEDPTVWDVDSLTDVMNDCLLLVYLNPRMFDKTPEVKKGLFWTIFLSRFKRLTFKREDTRHFVEIYGQLKSAIECLKEDAKEENITTEPADIFQAWKIVIGNFVFGC
jgi:hypothetical protein